MWKYSVEWDIVHQRYNIYFSNGYKYRTNYWTPEMLNDPVYMSSALTRMLNEGLKDASSLRRHT